ncbi:hypothetical protein [Jannaschia aquimarina]|uniref:Uncharacterized protein n=1 Tax=Jannaschia aquimarina TaxID=935700 RepID=A0A0D1ELW4_9RHOB|nr:hypothetical protein [Jannaschia aquimarina]KIT17966.1 hypothetical protein jaqu_02540 [Jannaschia aquimarina]SNT04821.1 hypothetical protein SAMN05421775_10518 [Jannaschia aquimarina]
MSDIARRTALAALAYVTGVFALGFALGVVRVTLILPHMDEMRAVLIELPIMIAASAVLAIWAVRRWGVPASIGPRLAMGALAFTLLMGLELGLSVTLFGASVSEHFARYATPPAFLGLAAQLVFASLPALLLLRPKGAL